MNPIQLDFFKTDHECEMDYLRQSVESYKISSDKVRRGTYARLNEVTKQNNELKDRLEIIERYICTGKL